MTSEKIAISSWLRSDIYIIRNNKSLFWKRIYETSGKTARNLLKFHWIETKNL